MRLLHLLHGLFFASAFVGNTAAGSEEEIVDFSDKIKPVCEVVGLTAVPPTGWFNVPIDSGDPALSGCQMMRAGADKELVGILRVLSAKLPAAEDAPPWFEVMLSIEQQAIAVMGYSLGEVLWMRDSVPVSGDGFGNARAVGLEAAIVDNSTPQEAHFLVFDQGPVKYIITLLTPAKSVEGSVFYKRNTADFGVLIRTMHSRNN